MVLWGKLWYYEQNYGTMDKTSYMLLYQELWNLIYEGKKHGRLPKTNLDFLEVFKNFDL